VSPPERLGSSQQSLVDVVPRNTRVLSSSAQDVVRDIRTVDAPFPVGVTGQTAHFVDLKSSLTSHLPISFGLLAATTVIVLFLMTGSLILPFKALLMNALSLSAAFGLLVLIFQDGRLEGFLGYSSQGALDATQPIVLFAVAFGLSTDYGVFLLSRIKEARDHGASDREAVPIGLERTGRIVTAAALLFCVAIGAFATSQIIFIKELGVGTALAVLIDATIVRALLVPSLMALLGKWNWWAPKPLRRLHQRIGLGEATAPA
jgi:RND superfamily putative drug exporter